MNRAYTEAETDLLDVADWTMSLGMSTKERRAQLGHAVNEVLAEAVHDGYQLLFDATDGVHLQTPSGLLVWFCPGYGDGEGFAVIVIDAEECHNEKDKSSLS